jgi:outer membrane protein
MNHKAYQFILPILAIAVLVVLSTPAPVMTQNQPLKIASVDVYNVFDNYKEVQELKKNLVAQEDALAQKESQFEQQMQSEIEKFNVQREMMSEDAVKQRYTELKQKHEQLLTELKQEKEKIQKLQADKTEPILTELNQVVRDYAKKEGYDFIFKQRSMAYVDDKYDITDAIIQVLEKK